MSHDRVRFGYQAAAAAAVALLAVLAPQANAQVNSKWLTVVLPSEPVDLDTCNSSISTLGRVLKQNLSETLIQKDPKDNALKPRLATSWQRVDPTHWEFKLRQGVTFHDGTPFNAAAVKKSLDRDFTKGLVCRDRVKYFSDFTIEVSTPDEYTLVITTSRPEPILPMRLTGITIGGGNPPTDKFSLAAIGTGPYALTKWQTGQEILLTRNEKYWGNKPQIEGVRYVWRKESSVRAAMVKVGEGDIAVAMASQDADDPKLDHSYLNSETSALRIDMTRKPLDDKRVRLAMNYAFDRENIRKSIVSKDALNATQFVFPAIPGHNHELDKMVRQYDPARAKQLLAEAKAAGVAVDTEITLLGRPDGYPNSEEVMEATLTTFKAVGLNVKLINLETGPYNSVNYKPFPENRGPTLLQVQHDNNFGDPVFSIAYRYSCDGGTSTYCDPKLDAELARVTGLEGDARVKGWQELFRVLYEDVVNEVWMYHMVGFSRVSPRIDYVPDVTANSEILVENIHIK